MNYNQHAWVNPFNKENWEKTELEKGMAVIENVNQSNSLYIYINGYAHSTEGRRYIRMDGKTSDDLVTWHDSIEVKNK